MDRPRSPYEQRHVAPLSIVAGCDVVRLEAERFGAERRL